MRLIANVALAAALVAVPAVTATAQDTTAAERAALAAALAQVNEENEPRAALPSARGAGFFGRGFYVTTDTAGAAVGAQRFGLREGETTGRPAIGERLLTR